MMVRKVLLLLVAAVLALVASTKAVTYCYEAPSIDNSLCYKDDMVLTESQRKGTFSNGEFVTYKCVDGYVLKGTAKVTCQSSGLWTARPSCELITTTTRRATTTRRTTPSTSCMGVPEINNGVCSGSATVEYRNNQQVSCSCSNGFKISGSANARCQTGQWTNVPSCTEVTTTQRPGCQGVPTIDNGSCTGSSGPSGTYKATDRANCTCKSGFRLVDNGVTVCSANGQWQNVPTCAVRLCYAAPSIANSECYRESSVLSPSAMQAGVFNVGETINYKCLSGYTLVGNAVVTCLQDGSWSTQPSCAVVCAGLPQIEGGSCRSTAAANADGSYKENAQSTCTCNSGFQASGAASARCVSGQWSLNFKCNLITTTVRTTTTQARCQGAPELANAKCVIDNDNGSGSAGRGQTATCRCVAGFALSTNNPSVQTSCGTTGQWGKISATCKEIPVCTSLPAISDGSCKRASGEEGSPINVGEKINCTCNDGFQIGTTNYGPTSAEVTCRAKDTWTALPKCGVARTTTIRTTTTMRNCPNPPVVEGAGCANCNESSSGSSSIAFTYGVQIRYTCRPEYNLVGTAYVTCQRDGTWTAPPKCELKTTPTARTTTVKTTTTTALITCPPPPAVEGAGCANCNDTARAVPIYRAGDQVRYTCRSGYKLPVTSNGLITCLKTGSWSDPPVCELISGTTRASSGDNLAGSTTTKKTNNQGGSDGNNSGENDSKDNGGNKGKNNNNDNNDGNGSGESTSAGQRQTTTNRNIMNTTRRPRG